MTTTRTIRHPRPIEESKMQGYFMISKRDAAVAITNKLTGSQCRLWLYLMTVDSSVNQAQSMIEIYQNIPTSTKIAEKIGVCVDTVDKDLRKLKTAGLLPTWFVFKRTDCADIERGIRDRLKVELGGEVEVITAVGRIDLLTVTEVIEIKNINNWKEALGKILAYSSFFPEHSKRIHLFGRPDLAKLALAQATCSEFGITVTFEEVES
ncbi:hypothetical protein IQ247_29415 [Plectonema cf. radiosum LEGE 06105]|uniref:Uncharacterized protein n=1 Tax=Plectonema cf. radiosum LEGE 06105 TaxID=945769 RepID=A0A8J7F9C7_9CYAN|nr:hypothetical protein [Plectonema radiosum]MBE9216725.1 hypothetical protein [Plectonema cf. radiosum LEGE 06105]